MEQQNNQPIEEKTETKPPMKTNWKFITIVVVLGLVAIDSLLLTPIPYYQSQNA